MFVIEHRRPQDKRLVRRIEKGRDQTNRLPAKHGAGTHINLETSGQSGCKDAFLRDFDDEQRLSCAGRMDHAEAGGERPHLGESVLIES